MIKSLLLCLSLSLAGEAAARAIDGSVAPNASITVTSDIKDTVKKSFKVRPGGTLSIDLDHGDVEIEAVRGDEVRIEVERIIDASDRDHAKAVLDRHDLRFDNRGNDVVMESRFDGGNDRFWGVWRDGKRLKVRVFVQIPAHYDVHFTSGAGNVQIGDISGRVTGRTGAGNIAIGAVQGDVDVTSGSGNIFLEGAEGHVEANTGAGNIEARNVKGEVRINTGAGNIVAHITEQPRDDSRLTSGAGNVTVYLDNGISVDVDAVASMGSANTDFPLRVSGKWMRKSFEGSVNGGGPALHLRAGVGNVTLRKI